MNRMLKGFFMAVLAVVAAPLLLAAWGTGSEDPGSQVRAEDSILSCVSFSSIDPLQELQLYGEFLRSYGPALQRLTETEQFIVDGFMLMEDHEFYASRAELCDSREMLSPQQGFLLVHRQYRDLEAQALQNPDLDQWRVESTASLVEERIAEIIGTFSVELLSGRY